MAEEALVICRTPFNLIADGADGTTPFMRVGLKMSAVPVEDILCFV